jgi:hypothetical protein
LYRLVRRREAVERKLLDLFGSSCGTRVAYRHCSAACRGALHGVDDMRNFAVLAGALVLGACGGSMDGSTMSAADTAAYNQQALQISSAVANYRAAAATMASPGDCEAAVEQYRAEVQPPVDGMGQMAGRMDGAMEAMGQGMGADAQCGVQVMQKELERHMAAACGSTDMAANQEEATRHCDRVQGFSEHMQMRADQAGEMMGSMMGGGMMGGTASTPADGGSTTTDGGTVAWDHTMPGCTYRDGSYQPDEGGATDGEGESAQ